LAAISNTFAAAPPRNISFRWLNSWSLSLQTSRSLVKRIFLAQNEYTTKNEKGVFILQVFWPRTSSEKSRLLDAAQIKMRRSNGIWRGDVMMAKSKFLSWLVLLTMIFTFLPVMTPAVQAGAGGDSVCTAVYVDDGNIVIDKDGISVGGMYMGFGPDGYIITQRDSVRETVYTITVEENVDTNITL